MKKTLKIPFKLLILALVFLPQLSHAGTPLEDIELTLKLESHDLLVDFDDADETVEKGRNITYAIEIKNTGPATHKDLTVFMGEPHYMGYQKESTVKIREDQTMSLSDIEGESPLKIGHKIDSLAAGESLRFELKYEVDVPSTVRDDPLYTLAFASLIGPHSALPLMSDPVNTSISGEPLGALSVELTTDPPTTKTVFTGSHITYFYHLKNAGGLPVDEINLITYVPEGTECLENCGSLFLPGTLGAGESIVIDMVVQVKPTEKAQEFIENIGFDLASSNLPLAEIRKSTLHALNDQVEVGTHQFNLLTEQVPNLILNTPNGMPRPDQGDVTETQYALQYTGRGKPNTYHLGSSYGIQDSGHRTYEGYCSHHNYPHGKQSTVYAYNSSGGSCDTLSKCPLVSQPLQFSVQTKFPKNKPRLLALDSNKTSTTEPFQYGDTGSVNQFMKQGGVIKLPQNFTRSRAVENGLMGLVSSSAESQKLTEDLWVYQFTGQYQAYDTCSCGEDCTHTDKYPVYTWQKASSTPITLFDEDETPISVYSSTAWLKTEGGHLGTNGLISHDSTTSNWVKLGFGGGQYMTPNDYIHDPDPLFTSSDRYTPMGEYNGERLIFSQNQNFSTSAGDNWEIDGVQFDFLERGNPYSRTDNARDFEVDLLEQERYGPVLRASLPSKITGNFDIADNAIWHHPGDLMIGEEEGDEVIFSGGQSRFYVEGDVYINSDVFYARHESTDANQMTALRIDARNIYIDSTVKNLELLLLARDAFYSGQSHHQLRILGDVIASRVHWQRKPVLELNPEDINPPSEYIIEDYRKFILPPPGDTTLPDEYGWWKQGNPGGNLNH